VKSQLNVEDVATIINATFGNWRCHGIACCFKEEFLDEHKDGYT